MLVVGAGSTGGYGSLSSFQDIGGDSSRSGHAFDPELPISGDCYCVSLRERPQLSLQGKDIWRMSLTRVGKVHATLRC
jgi:hypothetical protein